MKKKNKKSVNLDVLLFNIFLCIVLLAFVIIVIAYLVFSTGKSKNKLWDVHFSRIINSECSYGSVCTTPTIYTDSTTTGDYTVEFSSPGEKAYYEIDVVNDGMLDAEITSITFGSIKCKGNSDNYLNAFDDANKVCGNLIYNLYTEDGNKVLPGTVLKAHKKATYYLKLDYVSNIYIKAEDDSLSDTVSVSNLNLTINYNQVK